MFIDLLQEAEEKKNNEIDKKEQELQQAKEIMSKEKPRNFPQDKEGQDQEQPQDGDIGQDPENPDDIDQDGDIDQDDENQEQDMAQDIEAQNNLEDAAIAWLEAKFNRSGEAVKYKFVFRPNLQVFSKEYQASHNGQEFTIQGTRFDTIGDGQPDTVAFKIVPAEVADTPEDNAEQIEDEWGMDTPSNFAGSGAVPGQGGGQGEEQDAEQKDVNLDRDKLDKEKMQTKDQLDPKDEKKPNPFDKFKK